MWTKSIILSLLLTIQFLVIFQISYGKPTTEEAFNHSSPTTERVDIDVREDGDANSSFIETVSVLLSVISGNDSAAAEEYSPFQNNTASSTTTEPEYYDDHNLTTSSSTLNELEADEEDDEMMLGSVHLGSSTESSSLLSSLITDDMEVADSLDESVTATMLALKEDGNDVREVADDVGGTEDDDDGDRSKTADAKPNDGSGGGRNRKDATPAAIDDSIIITSMSSNLNVDTVEPLSSHHQHAINAEIPTKEEIVSSSHLLYDSSSSSSAAVEPTLYSFTEEGIHE